MTMGLGSSGPRSAMGAPHQLLSTEERRYSKRSFE
jgi:hypothetical protein